MIRALPIGIRAGESSLQQIDPSIEEAAADLGSNASRVFTTVTLPLIKSAFFGGLIYSFIRSMTSISAVIFLVSANYSTILILIVYVAIVVIKLMLNRLGSNPQKSQA